MNPPPPQPRVLLVEDEILVAGMLQIMLTTLGYALAGTGSRVDEVMQIIDREAIDAVVLDINLDGEMAYPIADELMTRAIPFLFSTGYGSESLPDGYEGIPLLKKPYRRSALGEALTDLLRQDGVPTVPVAGSLESDSKTADFRAMRTA